MLRMKDRFLRLQIFNQRLNLFDRKLIANCQGHSPIMLDLFVEFDALLAHGIDPVRIANRSNLIGRLIVKTIGREIVHSEI